MALSKLSGDEQRIIFSQLCNVLDPGIAVAFSSANSELRELTQALLQQLRTDHEAAATLCRRMGITGITSCKVLRKAETVVCFRKGLSTADLATLGTLGSVLPALEELNLWESSGGAAGHDGVQRLAEGLGAGALPAVTFVSLTYAHAGDAGAEALAAALGRGALPRLQSLALTSTGIGDAGLVALAPALRRRPALEALDLVTNPFGDEGLAALLAPPPPAGASSPPTGVLMKLEVLDLSRTQITDVGCAALASALDSGALPALEDLRLYGTPASDAAKAALMARFPESNSDGSENSDEE